MFFLLWFYGHGVFCTSGSPLFWLLWWQLTLRGCQQEHFLQSQLHIWLWISLIMQKFSISVEIAVSMWVFQFKKLCGSLSRCSVSATEVASVSFRRHGLKENLHSWEGKQKQSLPLSSNQVMQTLDINQRSRVTSAAEFWWPLVNKAKKSIILFPCKASVSSSIAVSVLTAWMVSLFFPPWLSWIELKQECYLRVNASWQLTLLCVITNPISFTSCFARRLISVALSSFPENFDKESTISDTS